MISSKTKNTYDLLCYSVVVVLYCIVVRCKMREHVEMYSWRAYREKMKVIPYASTIGSIMYVMLCIDLMCALPKVWQGGTKVI